jgi:hypothetical protein
MPTAPKAEVPTLQLPDWLPAAVREEVIKLQMGEFESHIEDGEDILIRLACDERMKKVWKYLEGREPVCAQPARFLDLDPRDPHSLEKIKSKLKASKTRLGKDEGQRQFLRHAFFYAGNMMYGQYVISRSEFNKMKAPYAQAAEKLEALAEALRSLNFGEYADQLKGMAPKVREGWREPDDDFWIVERDRARTGLSGWAEAAVLRRYIAELANFNRIVFGNVLYGTVATVTNVAFNLKETTITGRQVIEMLKAPPTSVL